MQNKTVIYTAVFGDYEGIVPQPVYPGFDYVFFTDNSREYKPWKTVLVNRMHKDPTLDARFHKILAHKHLKNYEVSIYIDANFLLINNPKDLITKYLGGDKVLAFFDHNEADDSRNCIYEEYEALLRLGEERGTYKDNPESMTRLINFLKAENYPQDNGLISSGVLVRRHNDPELIEVMENWWHMVFNYSKRDQLSFNYALWKNNFKRYSFLEGDIRKGNNWFYFLGHHRKNYKTKLLKFKIKRLFSKHR